MKKKSLLVAVIATGMMLPSTFGTISAVEGKKEIDVTYDNRSEITDPDNPNGPEWAVTIPSAITFTDDAKEVDASIELVPMVTGGLLPDGNVVVTIESVNGYKLENANGDAVGYKMIYGTNEMTATNKEAATLTKIAPKQEGKAKLGNDKAPTRASYSDKLNYVVERTI